MRTAQIEVRDAHALHLEAAPEYLDLLVGESREGRAGYGQALEQGLTLAHNKVAAAEPQVW